MTRKCVIPSLTQHTWAPEGVNNKKEEYTQSEPRTNLVSGRASYSFKSRAGCLWRCSNVIADMKLPRLCRFVHVKKMSVIMSRVKIIGRLDAGLCHTNSFTGERKVVDQTACSCKVSAF